MMFDGTLVKGPEAAFTCFLALLLELFASALDFDMACVGVQNREF